MLQQHYFRLPLILSVLATSEPDILAFLTTTVAKLRWDESSQMPLLRVRKLSLLFSLQATNSTVGSSTVLEVCAAIVRQQQRSGEKQICASGTFGGG